MKRDWIDVAVASVVIIVISAVWPLFRIEIAKKQIEGTHEFEARIIQELPENKTLGRVKLTPAQRERLVNSLDWDYEYLGKSIRGYPSTIGMEWLEFSSVENDNKVLIMVSPQHETNSFSGWVRAGGYNEGSRQIWLSLRRELFPTAPPPPYERIRQ